MLRGTTALRPARPVAFRSVDVRAELIPRTYVHLFGATAAAFAVIECRLFASAALMFWCVLRLFLALP
jgi:hypothetical protein